MDDVTREIAEEVRTKYRMAEIEMKPAKRKYFNLFGFTHVRHWSNVHSRYAFERADVPKGESMYLKVKYSGQGTCSCFPPKLYLRELCSPNTATRSLRQDFHTHLWHTDVSS